MGPFGRVGRHFRRTWRWMGAEGIRAMAAGEAFPEDLALGGG